MKKPKITVNCVANQYAADNEQIVEFSFSNGIGGLISLRSTEGGKIIVELYNHDSGIEIRVSNPK